MYHEEKMKPGALCTWKIRSLALLVATFGGLAQAQNDEKPLPPGVLAPMNPESVPFQKQPAPDRLTVREGDRIVIIGSGMASRMNHFPQFETEVFLRFPDKNITIRNMGDEGNTPGFRPHPGRNQEQQYAFPGARELLPPELQASSGPRGHFETPDQWLTRLEADIIIATRYKRRDSLMR